MKFETRPAGSNAPEIGSLTWILTFPDVEELSSLSAILPNTLVTVPVQWLHTVLIPEWSGHSSFDDVAELPDAPEDDFRLEALAMSGNSLTLEGASEYWQEWCEATSRILGARVSPLTGRALDPLRIQVAYGSAMDLGSTLGSILNADHVNFGRPRLALVRAEAADHGLTWRSVRSIATLTRQQREEIESSYRL